MTKTERSEQLYDELMGSGLNNRLTTIENIEKNAVPILRRLAKKERLFLTLRYYYYESGNSDLFVYMAETTGAIVGASVLARFVDFEGKGNRESMYKIINFITDEVWRLGK